MTKGPIIIIEDDPDDQELYADTIQFLGIHNQLRFFPNGKQALDWLYTTTEQPFIILSDVNMPIIDGLQLKQEIQADNYLRQKGIPFVFISTNASAAAIRKAHALSVQGYFQKPSSILELRAMLKKIFEYWAVCKHINNT